MIQDIQEIINSKFTGLRHFVDSQKVFLPASLIIIGSGRLMLSEFSMLSLFFASTAINIALS